MSRIDYVKGNIKNIKKEKNKVVTKSYDIKVDGSTHTFNNSANLRIEDNRVYCGDRQLANVLSWDVTNRYGEIGRLTVTVAILPGNHNNGTSNEHNPNDPMGHNLDYNPRQHSDNEEFSV